MKAVVYCFLGVIVFANQTNAIVDIRSFFPFGVDNGDQYLAAGDDTSSAEQFLSVPFNYFNKSHESLWVNVNGAISFLEPISTYTPSCEPAAKNYSMVLPFWADVDTKNEIPSPASAVSFRESTNSADLQKANHEVIYAFNLTNIELTWAFIVTWYNVTFFNDEPSRQIRNSFQAVLTTNGENSFVIFYYNKIQWTTGAASNGNEQGLGGTAAQVGFDAGDGNRYMLHLSCTKEVLYVNNLSNIGIPGEYVFQVDSNIIQTPPLITRPTRSTLPPLSTIATTATTICECTRKNIYLDIVAVMDNSQSMAEEGLSQIQVTLATIIGGLTINSSPGNSSRIALVTFASNAINVAGLNAFNNTDTFEEILFDITVLNDSNVDILSGLQMANTILSKNTDRQRVVILYTSAYDDTDFQDPVPLALNMRKDNIRIITVAFSQNMDSDDINDVGELAWPGFNFVNLQSDIKDRIYDALCQSGCTDIGSTTISQTPTSYEQNTTVPSSEPSSEPSSKPVLIIVASSVFLLIIIVTIGVIIFFCKKNNKRHSLVGIIVKQNEISNKDAKRLADTADRFQLSSNKISVNYDEIIGSGSTATVYIGFLHGTSALSQTVNKTILNQKYANCKVVIKIPKEMSRCETEQIMRELQAMRQMGYHAHIAVLLGWCFQNDLPSLVFELAQQDLHNYIQHFREPPESCMPLKQILSVAWQVSVGMQYVASFNMVHRDLAARNILLYDGFHAKISDFGLCCHCDESLTYQSTLNKKLPVRWLSIEALVDRRFSEKSDVWAFGIMLYEMCTNGSVPYALLSNYDILKFLESSKRLEKPETADIKLYNLMLDCWKQSTDERLSFVEVTARLQNHLEEETQTYGYLSMTTEESENLYS